MLDGVHERLSRNEIRRGLDPWLEPALGRRRRAPSRLRARRSSRSAGPRPRSRPIGRIPPASSRSSSIAWPRPRRRPAIDRALAVELELQVRSPSPIATRRCWAPSCRSRANRRRFSSAAVDAPPRCLYLEQVSPQLNLKCRDLDRQPGRADRAVQQVGPLGQRRVVDDRREREAAAAHGRAHPRRGIRALDARGPSRRPRRRRRGGSAARAPGRRAPRASIAPVASGAARPARRSSRKRSTVCRPA